MTKRKSDATFTTLQTNGKRGSLSHIDPGSQQSHGVTSDAEPEEGPDLKKPRTFMATLACDNCRNRKTRCDEDRPRCGFCRAIDAQCIYPEPRLTKKDQSMSVAINAIRRLEAKIEDLTAVITTSQSARLTASVVESPQATTSPSVPQISMAGGICNAPQPINDAEYASPEVTLAETRAPLSSEIGGQIPLSFSQHRVAQWPAVKRILPTYFVTMYDSLHKEYVIDLEMLRPPLSMDIAPLTLGYGEGWLTALPVATLKGLADAYFAVFNRITPVLDKSHFYSSTLGVALQSDFGYSIETCLVLNVLALGCLAVKAYEEGGFRLPFQSIGGNIGAPWSNGDFEPPEWYEMITDEPSGLRFSNEARKRMGFLLCQNGLAAAQFHMLSALYYAQVLRPIDSWTAVNRAAVCCLALIKRNEFTDYDTWEGDMKSRVFWNILMYETILIQELNLPLSGLGHYEAEVPIPKFTPHPRPHHTLQIDDEDDSLFNLHFLAQVAHRIILTRIRHSLYFFSEKEGVPSHAILLEMQHQLEQWKDNLPPALQFTDAHDVDSVSTSPAQVVARAMLKSRYLVAKHHMGRPFLYKVLHAPSTATEQDFRAAHDALKNGMNWPTIMGLCNQMKACLPIKFGWCCQFFGQIVSFHGCNDSRDPKLQETVPAGWREWKLHTMSFMEDCAKHSPAIAKDVELLKLL